jgi:hypothetical protein
MKMRALFREVWLELHPDYNNEKYFKYADSMTPGTANQEVPEDLIEPLRQKYLKIGREIDARSNEENQKYLNKFLSNN